MKIKIVRGVRIAGQAVFPKSKKSGKEVDVVLNVDEKLARELIGSGKAVKASDKAQITVDLKSQEEVDEEAVERLEAEKRSKEV